VVFDLVKGIAGEAGIVLELRIKKLKFFLVLIVLTRWFFELTHKVFGEMTVRT
jgi:hypothetical protein